ncbi:MAG: SynChlorMet cassette protein ScmC [bacterium]|nr:SynChlorMet cassette protein ScmC [bacterium]
MEDWGVDPMRAAACSLCLCNGQRWQLVGGWPDALSRIHALKAMMRLETPSDRGEPKVLLVSPPNGESHPRDFADSVGSEVHVPFHDKNWRRYRLRTWTLWDHPETSHSILVIEDNGPRDTLFMLWQALVPVFRRAIGAGATALHGALAEREGRGILLSAPSRTGKTTCSNRLPPPWRPVCDDRVLIVPNDQDHYRVHPIPSWGTCKGLHVPPLANCREYEWPGTWSVEHSVPLDAVFYLEQSPRDEVIPLGTRDASVWTTRMAMEMSVCTWFFLDDEERRAVETVVFDSACEIAARVPCYLLRVSLTGRFWDLIDEALVRQVGT